MKKAKGRKTGRKATRKTVKRIMKIDGLPVKDATSRVVLTITAGDIHAGKPGSPSACAAARACLRQLDCQAVRVHMGRIYIQEGKHWVRYLTPGSIRSEIIAYDRRTSFKPGDYVLNPQAPSHRGTERHKSNVRRFGTGKHPRAKPHFVTGVRVRAHS